jgi:hypothetical protein
MDFKYFSTEDWKSVKCKQGIIQSESYEGKLEQWDFLGFTDDSKWKENVVDTIDTPIPNYIWYTNKYSQDNKATRYVILHKRPSDGSSPKYYTPRNILLFLNSGVNFEKFRCVPDPNKSPTLPSLYSRGPYNRKPKSRSSSRSNSRSRSRKSMSMKRCPKGSRRSKSGQCKRY